jgi:hypothetical protein
VLEDFGFARSLHDVLSGADYDEALAALRNWSRCSARLHAQASVALHPECEADFNRVLDLLCPHAQTCRLRKLCAGVKV